MRRTVFAFLILTAALPAWSQIRLSLTPLSTANNPFVNAPAVIGPLPAGTVDTNPTGLVVTLTSEEFLWFSTDGTCDNPGTRTQQIQVTSPSPISVCLINLPTGGTFFALITASAPNLPIVSAADSVVSFPGGQVLVSQNTADVSSGSQMVVVTDGTGAALTRVDPPLYAAGTPNDWLTVSESPDCNTVSGGGSCTLTLSATRGATDQTNAVYTAQLRYTATDGGTTNVGAIAVTYTVPAAVTPVPTASNAYLFVPMRPCRLADTRDTDNTYGLQFGAPSLNANETRPYLIPVGRCPVPQNATAFSLNVTAIPHNDPSRGHGYLGYLTIWPAGETQPGVSTLNSWDGRTKANAVIVPAGFAGGVNVFVTDDADVVLDINGYFVAASVAGLQFFPLPPCRLFDTRNTAGPLGGPAFGAKESRDFPVLQSACGIPSTAQAYSVNMTAIPASGALQYLTVWPTGGTQPFVSTLNATTGTVTANAAIVPAGTDGSISVYVSDAADVLADINGYFAPPAPGGLGLYSVTPCRVFDNSQPPGTPSFTGMISPQLNASCGIPNTAQALVLNATIQSPGSFGYLTLWAAGTPRPFASTLNAFDGATTSNLAIVPATQGMISAYASDPGWLILDATGYFAP